MPDPSPNPPDNGHARRPPSPRDGSDDSFKPPRDPILVRCLHCGQEYLSNLIWFRKNPPSDRMPGFWWCPIEGCDGKGFEFDIHPLDGPLWGGDEDDDDSDDDAEYLSVDHPDFGDPDAHTPPRAE